LISAGAPIHRDGESNPIQLGLVIPLQCTRFNAEECVTRSEAKNIPS